MSRKTLADGLYRFFLKENILAHLPQRVITTGMLLGLITMAAPVDSQEKTQLDSQSLKKDPLLKQTEGGQDDQKQLLKKRQEEAQKKKVALSTLQQKRFNELSAIRKSLQTAGIVAASSSLSASNDGYTFEEALQKQFQNQQTSQQAIQQSVRQRRALQENTLEQQRGKNGATLERFRQEEERVKRLFNSGLISKNEFEELNANMKLALQHSQNLAKNKEQESRAQRDLEMASELLNRSHNFMDLMYQAEQAEQYGLADELAEIANRLRHLSRELRQE
ncbi:MAG: hypothetical protein MPJ24_01945 [Pirellulaceae bacterium]|nr:hypothetical protein [Pirellulaceae bacterium]